MKTTTIAVCLSLLGIPCVHAQQAQPQDGIAVESQIASTDQLSVVAGVRLWANRWDVPIVTREAFLANPLDPSSLMLRDVTVHRTSDYRFSPMPFVAARYGNFLASFTYLPTTSYDTGNALSRDVERNEYDINIGYYVHPRIVVSLGYKRGEQDRVTDQYERNDVEVEGALLGASFSLPFEGNWSVYGNAAFGKAWGRFKGRSSIPGASRSFSFDGDYKIGEIGLSYNLSGLLGGQVLKGAALTLGYRAMVLTSEGLSYGIYSPANPLVAVDSYTRDTRSTTDGFVLGLVAVF